MMRAGRLSGRAVLLVEDQSIIAMDMEHSLKMAGCRVVGPVGRLQAALALARDEQIDFALLDVNLFGETVFAAAEILEQRGIPFVLTTGYGEAGVPEGRVQWRVVSKPYDCDQLIDLIAGILGGRPSSSAAAAPV